jgi:hypothetical protein
VSFTAITLCVASQRMFIVVYFVIDSVWKLLDTPSYLVLEDCEATKSCRTDFVLFRIGLINRTHCMNLIYDFISFSKMANHVVRRLCHEFLPLAFLVGALLQRT